jgi:pimeloyl-ACP methyl ester carboxylesterase/lysophospholipase L1-like esterase
MHHSSLFRSVIATAALFVSAAAPAQEAERISTWHGGARHDFTCEKRAAILVCPATPAAGRPWIWRMEFFDHEPQADAALLAKGWHVAYLDVQNLYGAPKALDAMDAFYRRLTAGRGLSSRPVLEGFSRGGLFSLNWAIRHPDKVSSIYNDAPVCDFTSWPMVNGKAKKSPVDQARFLEAWGLTEEEARKGAASPINHLEPLAKAKIPLLHVVGDADEVVPYEENTGLLEQKYQALGGEIRVIHKPGVKHHPHSLSDPAPIVDFVIAHYKAGVSDTAATRAQPAKIDPALPNVLIIGDSISIGYHAETRRLLEGKANLWRVPVNAGPATRGVEFLDDWLAGRKWSVIHFNFGLHDLKHVGAKGEAMVDINEPGARYQVPLADYEKNLTTLTARLKATGAMLIWAETTPVPEGAKGRKAGDEKKWNEAAARVMTAAGVPVNPLHARAAEKPELQRPKDVHFKDAGSKHLAEKVAEVISAALSGK